MNNHLHGAWLKNELNFEGSIAQSCGSWPEIVSQLGVAEQASLDPSVMGIALQQAIFVPENDPERTQSIGKNVTGLDNLTESGPQTPGLKELLQAEIADLGVKPVDEGFAGFRHTVTTCKLA